MAALDVDVADAERTGLLEIRPWEQAHLRSGFFDKNARLGLLDEAMVISKAQGFDRIRLWANMEWALQDLPSVHNIVKFESRFNDILPEHDGAVVCTYDMARFSTKFSASVMIDILRTHPLVIMAACSRRTRSMSRRLNSCANCANPARWHLKP